MHENIACAAERLHVAKVKKKKTWNLLSAPNLLVRFLDWTTPHYVEEFVEWEWNVSSEYVPCSNATVPLPSPPSS
jgi:hypothetical protein